MNKIKTGNESISEIIFDYYNQASDLLKDNKGVIAQSGLGALELYGAIKGMQYAKEIDNTLLKGISAFILTPLGGTDIFMGAMLRPILKHTPMKYIPNDYFVCAAQITGRGFKELLSYNQLK